MIPKQTGHDMNRDYPQNEAQEYALIDDIMYAAFRAQRKTMNLEQIKRVGFAASDGQFIVMEARYKAEKADGLR